VKRQFPNSARRWLRVAGRAALLWMLLGAAVVSPAAVKGEELLPIATAETVAKALAFDEDERTILEDVKDGDTKLNMDALYVLLRRAEMLPEGPETFEEAEQPNPKSFWTEPQRYHDGGRPRLVRVAGSLYSRPTDWSEEVKPTRWWGTRPVYVLYLKAAGMPEPVLVFLTRKPPEKLPRQLQVAGLFYKVVRRPENPETGDPDTEHLYPVIVAKEIFQAGAPGGLPFQSVLIVVLVVVLLAAFFLVRRWLGRTPARSPGRHESMPAAGEDRRGGQDEADSEEVDEQLRREVEAFRAARGASGKGEHADGKNDSG